ncbi:hypothetical protein N0V82_004419 [Gnomoniopsis sp. IMI 355080]|nr:hypothetical protein N0V82_004419 [Gnomoniopsis sp. IMI 355080]
MSMFCKKCQVIQFDDKEHNGSVRTSTLGDKYVAFDPVDERSPGRLFLDYELRDNLPDLPKLCQSAKNGCALCCVVKNELVNFFGENSHSIDYTKHTELFIHKLCYSMRADSRNYGPWDRLQLQGLIVYFKALDVKQDEEELSFALRLEIQVSPADPCARWLSIPRRPVEGDLLSQSGVQRLNELIDRALSIRNVSTVTQISSLPTRLLDVGLASPGEAQHEPRLVITSDYPPLQDDTKDRRYMALSYCWGPPDKAKYQLMTEIPTLDARLREIPFTTLPRLLQDSVRLCRALGVRYIWIDSLCIIQDDKADWEREAEQMGNFYANAYFTICAAQGDSCLDSFLERKVPPRVVSVPFTLSLNPSISGLFSMFVSQEQPIRRDLWGGVKLSSFLSPDSSYPDPYWFAEGVCHNSYKFDLEDAGDSWNSRGWTFQEAKLSPRALLFGQTMVHLCIDGELLESEDALSDGSYDAPSGLETKCNEHRGITKRQSWQSLIREYSARSLTYQRDILPALSALAQLWAAETGSTYLAGLFSDNLHHGLLWAHHGMRTPSSFLDPGPGAQYTAPSWSWASQPDRVSWVCFMGTVFEPQCQLLENHINPDGLNPYGCVIQGSHIILSAQICRMPGATTVHREPDFFGFTFSYALLSANGTRLAHLVFDWRHADVQAPLDPKTGEECEDGPVDQLSMVLISNKISDAWVKAKADGEIMFKDLLLGLLVISTGQPGEYSRAGLFLTEADGPMAATGSLITSPGADSGENPSHNAVARPEYIIEYKRPVLVELIGPSYIAHVTVGTKAVPLLIDTGSSDIWVVPSSFTCLDADSHAMEQTDCGFPSYVDDTFSGGVVSNNYLSIIYGNGQFTHGPYGLESVSLGGITVPNQQIALPSEGYLKVASGDFSGILGLGYPGMVAAREGKKPKPYVNNTDPIAAYDTWFSNAVKQNLTAPLFSMALDMDGGGLLVIGGVVDVPIIGGFATTPILMRNLINDIRADTQLTYYTIIAEDYIINGEPFSKISADEDVLSGKIFPVIVDSGFTTSPLPPSLVTFFYDAFVHAPQLADIEGQMMFAAPCNTNIVPTFGVQIDGQTFEMTRETLLVARLNTTENGTAMCALGLQPGIEEAGLLGDTFLSNIVAVFDVGNSEMRFAQRGFEVTADEELSPTGGFELVKQLLAQTEPYRFIIGARDTATSKKAFDELKYDSAKHSLTLLPLELANLKGVGSFAQQTLEKLGNDKIDYLFLNAGMVKDSNSAVQGSKWCEPFIVNHLSQHYLTHLLREKLVASKSRIVVVSSGAIRRVSDPSAIDKHLLAGSGEDAQTIYSDSKFVQLLAAHWWRRQLQGSCDVVAVSPGLIPQTSLSRYVNIGLSMSMPDAKTVPEGAQSILRAFTRDDFPSDPDQIFLTSWGEWWSRETIEKSLDKALQDKWSPSQAEIEKDEGITA